MAYTRQKIAPVDPGEGFNPETVWKGAYVLEESDAKDAITIVATGSEVPLAVEVAKKLGSGGRAVRVVSAPCLELFDEQSAAYRKKVLGDRSRMVTIEAGSTIGWHKYTSEGALHIGIDRFGASAPAEALAVEYGLTPDAVIGKIEKWIEERPTAGR